MFNLSNIPLVDRYYLTVVFVTLSLLGLLFLVEILLRLNDIPYDNINLIVRRWAFHKFYFITFLVGVISGHLFLGTTINWLDCAKLGIKFECSIFSILIVAALSIILLIVGILTQRNRTKTVTQYILYAAGLMVGHFVWSLNSYS